jgi:FKBP-type peptidyl-prolyl cis-trans isomerase (trigger factor)
VKSESKAKQVTRERQKRLEIDIKYHFGRYSREVNNIFVQRYGSASGLNDMAIERALSNIKEELELEKMWKTDSIHVSNNNKKVCELMGGRNFRKENSSLIAAAPAMLKALENIISNPAEISRRQKIAISNLIKKAKGET